MIGIQETQITLRVDGLRDEPVYIPWYYEEIVPRVGETIVVTNAETEILRVVDVTYVYRCDIPVSISILLGCVKVKDVT